MTSINDDNDVIVNRDNLTVKADILVPVYPSFRIL